MDNDEADNSSEKVVVVFSGGPDSTAAAKWAIEEGYEPELVSYRFDDDEQYGEMRSAIKVAERLGAEHTIIDFKSPLQTAFAEGTKMFRHAGVKSAFDDEDNLDSQSTLADDEETRLAPFASGILLSLTASYALYHGINDVVWGATKDDSQTDVTYQEGFSGQLADLISSSMGVPLDIHVPISDLHKYEIVEAYRDDPDLFALTWSCKVPVGDVQCGTCHACVARRVAAQMAGVEDDTQYHSDDFDNPFTDEQIENPHQIDEYELGKYFKTIMTSERQ